MMTAHLLGMCFSMCCLVQGCFSSDMAPNQGQGTCRNYKIDSLTFRCDRSKVLFRDLANPGKDCYADMAGLFWPRRVEDPWREAELYRVADETLARTKLSDGFSEHGKESDVPTICIEIEMQSYVTDGKATRPTDYFALSVGVKVFSSRRSSGGECRKGSAFARRHVCWGTASFSPIRQNDLYALFSEALKNALGSMTD